MRLEIGFGNAPQTVDVPDERLVGVLTPNEVPASLTGTEAVAAALRSPIGTGRLRELVSAGEKVAVITSDLTRPLPSAAILPLILDELAEAGVPDGDVTVVFALGSHRKHTPDEMRRLVGEAVYRRVRCVDSDSDDCVSMGNTAQGTPVDITRVVAEADRRIGVGNIEYHYFAGYSGGAKAIMPGVSTRVAIQSNHSRMVLSGAEAGRLEGNPVREDLEEALLFCPLDFIVNVVLDEHKKILHAVSGDAILAHREGCRFLDRLYRKEIPARASVVIASQGGAPKDLNLYQTQKALDNAARAVKDGGVVILTGSCKEGMGEDTFARWMTDAKAPGELVERIRQEFRLGGHKAAAIGMVLERAAIYLVSDMEPAFVKSIFLTPFATVQSALDAALAVLGGEADVLVMPYAGSTLPVISEG